MNLTNIQLLREVVYASARALEAAGDRHTDKVASCAEKTQTVYDKMRAERVWQMLGAALLPLAGIAIQSHYGAAAPLLGPITTEQMVKGLSRLPELIGKPYFELTGTELTAEQDRVRAEEALANKRDQTVRQIFQQLLQHAEQLKQPRWGG